MSFINRRKFISTGVSMLVMPVIMKYNRIKGIPKKMNYTADMKIGIITGINDPSRDIERVKEFGFDACQVSAGAYVPGIAGKLKEAFKKNGVTPVSMICHGPGPYVYNFREGPETIGLIPRKYRAARIERLKQGIEICKEAGIPAVQAHFGFIPENPNNELYIEFVDAMKDLGAYALQFGTDIYFETGQETPVTLRRAIEDIGTGNLFVNYDTANLILYGKANPLDGLSVIGKYLKSFHIKDGFYPTDPYKLGKEAPIPEGLVDFPGIIGFLKKNNFSGSLVIENEMSSNTREYLAKTKKYLEQLINS